MARVGSQSRLLRAVARRLRRWADFVLRDEAGVPASEASQPPAPPPAPVGEDDGPPAHWVERVRRAAPELLRPPAGRSRPVRPPPSTPPQPEPRGAPREMPPERRFPPTDTPFASPQAPEGPGRPPAEEEASSREVPAPPRQGASAGPAEARPPSPSGVNLRPHPARPEPPPMRFAPVPTASAGEPPGAVAPPPALSPSPADAGDAGSPTARGARSFFPAEGGGPRPPGVPPVRPPEQAIQAALDRAPTPRRASPPPAATVEGLAPPAGDARRERPSEAARLFWPEAAAPRGDRPDRAASRFRSDLPEPGRDRLDGAAPRFWPDLPEPGDDRVDLASPRFWPELPGAAPRAARGADELDIEAPLSAQERRRRIDREQRGA